MILFFENIIPGRTVRVAVYWLAYLNTIKMSQPQLEFVEVAKNNVKNKSTRIQWYPDWINIAGNSEWNRYLATFFRQGIVVYSQSSRRIPVPLSSKLCISSLMSLMFQWLKKKIRDDTWSKLNWTKFLVRLRAEAGDPLLQQTVTIHIYAEKILQKFREEPTVTT